MYTSLFITLSNPIESRVISKVLYNMLASTWFFVSDKYSKEVSTIALKYAFSLHDFVHFEIPDPFLVHSMFVG